ncbi:MAG: hypothetical protein JO027_10845 [Solirubrobacterales bacterium]|nr:hypothetical protein [Solirubrobacterales bacterium]
MAAFSLFLAFPALSSAHTLAVSVSPSQCVTPLSGEYTATVTVTEAYFSGTIENIPVGRNVYELSASTDKGNTGLNQNYFTQGSVGTQTGLANLGQPTSFSSPSNGSAAKQTFTVTTSVPETYVLSNSYMKTPATATITAPTSGCTPPPGCPTGQSLVNGACVPPTSCPTGQTLSGGVCVPPTSCPTGQVLSAGKCVPPTTCPNGQILSGGQCVPPTSCPSGQVLSAGQCVPPTTCPNGEVLSGGQCVPPTTCPSGETLSGGQCVPPTTCPAGESLSGGLCAAKTVLPPPRVFPAVCRASTQGYTVRAGQVDTIIVSVHRQGAAVSGTKVRITLPGNKVVTRTTGKSGKATFIVEPAQSGTIFVRSPSCKEMIKVKVYAAKAATVQRAPSFTG